MAASITTKFKKLGASKRPKLSISFNPQSRLKLVEITTSSDDGDKKQENAFVPVYSKGADIDGQLEIILPDNLMKFEYEDIAIYLVGHIVCDDLDTASVFLSRKIILDKSTGILTQNSSFPFKFVNLPLTFDSYHGSLFKCRYFLRAVVTRSKVFQSNIKMDQDFVVMNLQKVKSSKPVSMQVGVGNCLHIKFEYASVNLAVDGCLEGTVKVVNNTLKITTMQIQLIRREMVKAVHPQTPEVVSTTVLGKFEIMDGFPADGEEIPIRLFLSRFKSATNTQITQHFSIRYYVNLGLIDQDGRRYFKTCEITLFRTKIL